MTNRKRKRIFKNEEKSIKELWNNTEQPNLCIVDPPKEKGKVSKDHRKKLLTIHG